MTRPSMRFVPIKSAEQQAALMLHRARDLLIWQRTMLINALRGHMAELGIIVPQGAIRHARTKATPLAAWIRQLLERRPAKLVSVALANNTNSRSL